MIGRLLGRRMGPVGIVLVFWEIWKRIPSKHRWRLLRYGRRHGVRVAKQAYKANRRRRRRRRLGR